MSDSSFMEILIASDCYQNFSFTLLGCPLCEKDGKLLHYPKINNLQEIVTVS